MNTLADVIQQYGAAYLEKFGDRLLLSHRRALRDIAQCRSAVLGAHCARMEMLSPNRHRTAFARKWDKN